VNDQPEHARELGQLLAGMLCHVNLIGLNPVEHYPGTAPSRQSMDIFSNILQKNNIPTSIRNSQGADINAACGQLAGRNLKTH
jgi:23S rRNA (adenine2503-C2)-methyltransferase